MSSIKDNTKSMKCHKCGTTMTYCKVTFNEHIIDGWKCSCGEVYYNPEKAQRILILNKLGKEPIRIRLSKMQSNLILKFPKDIESAYGLEKDDDVVILAEEDGFRIIPV